MRTSVILAAAMLLAGCQSTPLPDGCYMKPESGRCRAAITRYYFDERENRCKAFIWGGCGGVVPYDTQDACFEQCGGDAPDRSKPLMETLHE